MMGYMIAYGLCVGCKLLISFNPDYVPSIRVNGSREPLCVRCFDLWNRVHRVDRGLEPLALHPMAYEPQPEIEDDF